MIRKSWLVLAVMAAVLAVPATALAHVEITPEGAPGDDDVMVAALFVEAECPSYTATAQLVFPDAPELTVATPVDVEGWTSAVVKRAGSEAIESVTWTNAGQVAGDGNFRLAIGEISVDDTTIDFKAVQVCDDGETLRWIEAGADGEFPAPVLTISHDGHTDSGDGHAADHAADGDHAAEEPAAKKKSDDSSTGVIIGVGAAVVALGIGAFALSRRKQGGGETPAP